MKCNKCGSTLVDKNIFYIAGRKYVESVCESCGIHIYKTEIKAKHKKTQ